MRRSIPLLVLVVTCLAVASPAGAFDGKRKGFMMGAGLGPAATSFTQKLEVNGLGGVTSDRENKFGVGTDFRIGAGLSEQFMLYYVNRVSWFPLDNALGKRVTIANAVGLLGASWYLQPAIPSMYVTGLVGLASWSTPLESNTSGSSGPGAGLGLGYEFATHWSVEGNFGFGAPSDESGGVKLTTNASMFTLTIHGTAF